MAGRTRAEFHLDNRQQVAGATSDKGRIAERHDITVVLDLNPGNTELRDSSLEPRDDVLGNEDR